jgi:hypothetical protein
MQFQLSRYEYVKSVEFKTDNPLQDVERIRYFKEFELTGNFVSKEFRYSWDNSTWTNWNTLTQQNLANIEFRDRPNFYLHIKYNRQGVGTANIQRWYLFYDSNTPTPPGPVDASIDAYTLQGQLPAYYLDRENHFGPYTDLQVYNVPDGSAIGVYYGRIDTSNGTELIFKRLEGGSGVSITEDGFGKIIIDASGSGGGGETYQNPNPTIEGVGGIPDGSTYFLSAKTFAQVMEDMFYPLAFPSFTNPSNTLNDNVSPPDLVIAGTDLSFNLTSTLNRGTITPAYGTDGKRSGPGIAVHFNGPDVSIVYDSYPGSTKTHTIPAYDVSIGYQTWYSYWDVSTGNQPLDSKGNPYMSPYPSQALAPASTRIEGVYPIYATTANITTLSQQPLISMINGNQIQLLMVAEPPFGSDRQKFDLPNAWISSRPLISIQFYSELEQAWKFEGGTAASSLTYWTASNPGNKLIQGNSIPYTRYSYNPAERQGQVLYRLNFS